MVPLQQNPALPAQQFGSIAAAAQQPSGAGVEGEDAAVERLFGELESRGWDVTQVSGPWLWRWQRKLLRSLRAPPEDVGRAWPAAERRSNTWLAHRSSLAG